VTVFGHGVASGDPLPHGVHLWTRCSPAGDETVKVDWWIGPTSSPGDAVDQGRVEASAAHDFTVHVDASGLSPATTYRYGFTAGGVASPVGRTRTAPVGPVDNLRIGLASCAAWPSGFFNAYANLASRDLDLVVHVGDYIYESGRGDGSGLRSHRPPRAVVTLADYRTRHAQYRTDPDLQALHASHPTVVVWDDHDLIGGTWRNGAAGHSVRRHGRWEDRRDAAVQAWFEWMPVRRPDPAGDPYRVFRRIDLGDLATLVMLDARMHGRDRPMHDGVRPALRVTGPARSLLGEDQWRWLEEEVSNSTARWLLVGNQVMLAPLRVLAMAGGIGVNPGQWDGFPAERDRLYDTLRRLGRTSNVAVLSGDIHSSWAAELPVGAELVTPSVTSDDFARTVLPHVPGAAVVAEALFRWQNPHLRMGHLRGHGYVVLDVTPGRIQADWWHVATVRRRQPAERWIGGWVLADGALGLTPAEAPTPVIRQPAAGRTRH
jgi:phosphodiesterase/alkaline phosphatase D-like protein